MFTFAYPGKLFLLFLIPAFILLFMAGKFARKKRLERLGNTKILDTLMPQVSPYKPIVSLSLGLVALFGIIFAMARPWGGVRSHESSREGIEIVIAVDASNSMLASATSDENGTQRIKMAKLILEKLINRLGNDKVGLISYAGDAYTLIPVTNDYVSAKAFLNSIEPELIANQGTNIGAAVNLAENSFSERSDVGRAIVLLTDAEELEDSEGVLTVVKEAAKKGIQTDVIGIGSSPVTIPDAYKGRMVDDATGEVVRTALNEDLAVDIAKAGDGIYVNAANDDAVDELMKRLGTLKKATLESSFYVEHDELYFPFVLLAVIMLILDFFLTEKKNKWLDKISFFSKNSAILFLVVIVGVISLSCNDGNQNVKEVDEVDTRQELRDSLLTHFSLQKEHDFILRGNEYHNTGNLEAADSNYVAALTENQASPVASLNNGVNAIRVLMAMEASGDGGEMSDSISKPILERAKASFQNAAAPKVLKGNVSSMAFYNAGNIAFVEGNYSQAIEEYKEALRLNPDDDHARRNLRIAQLQKNENRNQQKNQDNQQQNQENQEDQNQEREPQQQDRQQLNEQTSEQILKAAERKENLRRLKKQNSEPPENSSKSNKKW